MPVNALRAFYYESFPIGDLTYFDNIPLARTGGIKTGGMGAQQFDKLKHSIEAEGLINPVFVQDESGVLKVQLGSNRIEVMKQLGHDSIKAVIVTKGGKDAPHGDLVTEDIPLHKFDAMMKRLHPGDSKYTACPYARNIRRAFRQEPE